MAENWSTELKTFVAHISYIVSIVDDAAFKFQLEMVFFSSLSTQTQDVLFVHILCVRAGVGCNLEKCSLLPVSLDFVFAVVFFSLDCLLKVMNAQYGIHQECSLAVHNHGKKSKTKYNNSGTLTLWSDAKKNSDF